MILLKFKLRSIVGTHGNYIHHPGVRSKCIRNEYAWVTEDDLEVETSITFLWRVKFIGGMLFKLTSCQLTAACYDSYVRNKFKRNRIDIEYCCKVIDF